MHSANRIRRWIALSSMLLGMLVALSITTLAARAGMAPDTDLSAALTAGAIHGYVTDPAGVLAPAGTCVQLWRPDGSLVGRAAVAPDNGAFALGPIPNGNYVLRAVPPALSALTSSLPRAIRIAGAAINAGIIQLTTPSLTGTVMAPDGQTPAEAWIGVYRRSGRLIESTWTIDGGYHLGGIVTGTYTLRAKPTGNQPFWWSTPLVQPISPTLPHTADLTLRPANIFGVVHDPNHIPVQDAVAHVHRLTGHGHAMDDTNQSGYFAVGGLVTGTFLVEIRPPYWRNDLLPVRQIFTVTAGSPPTDLGILEFRTAPKVVQGIVHTNLHQPVENGLVVAQRISEAGRASAYSGADGRYQLHLNAGTWALTVRPVSGTVPADWVFPLSPQVVHFSYDESPEVKTVNLEVLAADSHVVGQVTLPGDSAPAFAVTVQLRSSEGIGAGQVVSADGRFDVALPHGAYQVWVRPADPQFAGPPLPPVHVPPTSTVDLGIITLVPRDALIAGTVVDEFGDRIEGVRVVGRTRDQVFGDATSGPDGEYAMTVVSGTWLVNLAPSSQLPFIYTGTQQVVTVSSGETAQGINWQLHSADATIAGRLVTESGDPATGAAGWAGAGINGAPVENGTFAIPVPAGTYTLSVRLAAHNAYLTPRGPVTVTVGPGETGTVTLAVREGNSTIWGGLWDPRQQETTAGVDATVLAWSDWAAVGAAVDPDNGAFHLHVSGDLWHLGYEVDPSAGYVQLNHRIHVPVESGQTIGPIALPVTEKDSLVQGIVLDPAGSPYTRTLVVAEGIGLGVEEVTLQTRPGADGRFRLRLPHGLYDLRAIAGPQAGYLNPTVRLLAPPAAAVPGIRLQFREPDATISGTVTISGSTNLDGRALVWGWSPAGGCTKTTADLGGTYTLDAISNTVWHVGAVFETDTAYWVDRQELVLGSGNATKDLVLAGPHPKPAPVAVSWDAAESQFVTVSDGTSLYLPAGSLPVTGTVTLHVIPVAGLPRQPNANVFGYGWALEAVDKQQQPITSQFSQNVIVAFKYSDAELARWGIEERFLKPAYFSTSANRWSFPQSYVVDPVGNRVTMQIDHFTEFALVGGNAANHAVYLPLVLH